MNEATSPSVSERCISAAICFSSSGVGTETGMVSSCSETASWRGSLSVKVTRGEVTGPHFPQLGLDLPTDIAEVRLTARVEAAAGGRVERTGDLAPQDDLRPLALDVGIRRRDRRHERLAVGVQSVPVQVSGVGDLHDLAEVHH